MLRKSMFILVAAALLLTLIAGTALAQRGGDPVKGKTLWEQKNCKSCHGVMGEGAFAGPRAGDGKSAADWIKQARTPRANMPAYTAAQIGDQDLTDMNAYLQTLAKPASFTAPAYVAGPDDPAGKTLFNQKRCVACHGDPVAFIKARFSNNGRTVTSEAVLKQLRTPAKNMPTFSATQVTDAQATLIADFFKSIAAPVVAAPAPVAAATPPTLPVAGGSVLNMLPGLLALAGLAVSGLGYVVLKRRR